MEVCREGAVSLPEADTRWRDGRTVPAPVGSFKPDPWGLFDMHGNVQEWCSDWHGPYPQVATQDPTGPAKGTNRVTRGGSWAEPPAGCTSAARKSLHPAFCATFVGFRVVTEDD